MSSKQEYELDTHYARRFGVGSPGRRMSAQALCGLFTNLDRIVGGRRHKSVVVQRKPRTPSYGELVANAPSYTDGTNIWLDGVALDDAVQHRGTDLMSLYGLNYHEMAHVLYTPRIDGASVRWIESQTMRADAFNILEDMRIERLMRQQYPAITPYLLAAVYKYYYNIPKKEWDDAWHTYIMVAERRYVPRSARQEARDLLVARLGEQVAQEVEKIESTYITLGALSIRETLLPTEQRLIEKLAAILRQHMPRDVPLKINFCQDGSHKNGGGSKRAPAVGMGELRMQEIDGDDGEPLDGETKDGKVRVPRKKVGQKGYSSNPRAAKSDIVDFLEGQMEGNADVKRDLQQASEVIDEAKFILDPIAERYYKMRPVTSGMRQQKAVLVDRLTELQESADPGWEAHTPSGRLNMNRVMGAGEDPDWDQMFDEWQEDKSDALELDVYCLADVSGSMAGNDITEASKALWVFSSAFDEFGARITLISFEDTCYQIRPDHTKEDPHQYRHLGTRGGTTPRVGIAKARHDLERSNARNKVFILYTDGGWWNAQDDIDIQAMRDSGVATLMILFGEPGPYYNMPDYIAQIRHNCEHFAQVNNGEELADAISKLVLAVQQKSLFG